MNLAATLFCAVSTLLSVQAITVSVDRADVHPITPPSNPSQSMFVNGWRPLTNYDTIGVNVSPASNLDRSYAPVHPVISKLQEHMSASERLKPQRVVKAQQPVEYSPPSILGSFALFNQATPKQRKEGPASTDPKTLSTEREYSFLSPPPRDAFRFELESQKKISVLNEPYVRSSQFIPQAIKPDPRSPAYYIKPASFSTAVHPFSQARPFITNYNLQQSLVPARHPIKQFEGLKPSNEKPYYQSSNPAEVNNGFNKDAKPTNEQNFERFQQVQQQVAQQQAVQQQVVNNNYYNQINHPVHYKQPNYERNPAFLVHDSHQTSYVTPSTYKFQPSTYHFVSQHQEAFPSSTAPPKVETNKFADPRPKNAQSEGLTKYQTAAKEADKHRGQPNAYYVQDFQKTRYAPDINEVLPKVNQPVKFHQIATTATPYMAEHSPKVVYVRPELQQQQYQSSIIPLNINQRPSQMDYETPESVSLKHFNEQQFLLQQQLIQQDRQRLREQEKRRQQELQRQQEEEVRKRQHEIKLLEQKHKEKQRLEQLQTQQPEIVKEALPNRHQYSQAYPVEEQKKVTQDQYKQVYHQQQFELPQTSTEIPFVPSKQVTVQKFEEVFVTPVRSQGTDEDFQPVIRPYRPQKPPRDQLRRRKPTTVPYDPTPTEIPTAFSLPEAPEDLTDVPIQTTAQPEITTVPVTERIIRTRRPGTQLRRRRPHTSTSTTTQEPIVSSQEYNEEVYKYSTSENQEFEKKKRVRPVSSNHGSSSERRPLRKRPGHRGKLTYSKEPGHYVERKKTTEQPFREISATDNYPEPFLKELYSSELYNPTSEKTLSSESSQESSTESIPIEFYAETTPAASLEYYEPTHEDQQEYNTQKAEEQGALDHVFSKTEVNYIETTTAPYPSTVSTTVTTTTTTTTTEAPTTTKTSVLPPKVTHRTRPMRYGNATRPRFSIKDYKSRMDYKNRLAQSSSTEPSTVTAGTKLRGHKNQQAPADPNFKEVSGRYKYMSRSSYRTTSTTTPTSLQPDDNSATTDKSRFTPKKRINTSHYYRSRVTTTSPNKADQDHLSGHSTARPENVFSSSIRKRPTLKSRIQPSYSADRNKLVAHPEMQSAAETGFFATTTVGSLGLTEAANEIGEHEETKEKKVVSENQTEKAAIDLSDITMEENDEKEKYHVPSENESDDKAHYAHEEVTEAKLDDNQQPTSSSSVLDSTTPFDIRHEEELFAKASQSVADLTSSASALYDKPGMFKAVSPTNENRAISAHLKIATDEPTLPIEAFFQEIAKQKN